MVSNAALLPLILPACLACLPSEWWEARLVVPLDAAVLNFVVTYFEHCDNNARADFKVRGGAVRCGAGRGGAGRASCWMGACWAE